MSRSIVVFLRSDLPPAQTAGQLATALDAELTEDDEGRVFVSRPARHAEGEKVGGQVTENRYSTPPGAEPGELSVLDGYDTTYDIRFTGEDEATRRAEADGILTDIADRLGWPALLVENLEFLVAAWHPEHGRTDFPAGTTPDPEDRAVWQKHSIGDGST